MVERLVECVPNFSEGKDLDLIKQITDVIEQVDGTTLLNVDPGAEMNRTVVTFIGAPEAVKEAAFQAIKKASELIDMTKHKGSHPRMGATDVCPFVPVSGVSEEEALKLAEEVAERVGNELAIPIYLYEKSARSEDRVNLAVVRQGEYEGFEEKIKKPEWKPDFGPAKFNKKSGATAIGVREFLIAYNINLNTNDVAYARDIAWELREKGRSARYGGESPYYFKIPKLKKYKEGSYPCGECDFTGATIQEIIDHCKTEHGYDLVELLKINEIDPDKPEGESAKKAGRFQHCKAIGWYVPEFDRAQISINLTNYHITSMHHVLDATRELAAERGLVVTGSEIVGMVPFQALYESAVYYLKKQDASRGLPLRDLLEKAAQSLGIRDVAGFDIQERVLGLPKIDSNALVEMKVNDFTDEVSRDSPAPGGGSIAALSGALGAALSSMVSNLTLGKRSTVEIDNILMNAAEKCQESKAYLIKAVDDDTNAFNAYMDARRLPKKTAEEKAEREKAMQDGLKLAVEVPLGTARESLKAIEQAAIVVEHGNPNSITDVGVGAIAAYTGVKGGIYNVLINLKDIKDQEFCDRMRKTCKELDEKAKKLVAEVSAKVEAKIG